MDQLDALALAGQCLLGVLGFMALIGLALLLVNWIGRRRGEKTGFSGENNGFWGSPPQARGKGGW